MAAAAAMTVALPVAPTMRVERRARGEGGITAVTAEVWHWGMALLLRGWHLGLALWRGVHTLLGLRLCGTECRCIGGGDSGGGNCVVVVVVFISAV